MAKYPSEVFGFYVTNNGPEAIKSRQNHWCPYHDSICFKKSRLLEVPFGVCTAHFEGDELALCPRRFLENKKVFKDIANLCFQTTKDIILFSEVGLQGIGNFDFVMVKHKALDYDIEDFIIIEFQTGQTTNTGKLVDGFKDYISKAKFPATKNYNFGINYYDIWKRTFTQILNKGIILEKWKKKIFWVVQDQIFNYFQKKYRLTDLNYDEHHSTVFSLYDLKISGNKLDLIPTKKFSSTIDSLFDSFRKNEDIPSVDIFYKHLKNKMKKEINLSLKLDFGTVSSYIDAPRPSSTGRIREENNSK